MHALRRAPVVLVAALAAVLPTFTATASTADDLEAAKQRLADARTAANEARALAHDAEVQLEETQDRIAGLEQTIADLKARAASLHDIVRKRALYAYTHAGHQIDEIIGTVDPLAAARGRTLLDLSNQKDSTAARRLAGINSDLREQTTELRAQETRQKAAADDLAARNDEFQKKLVEAQQAADALQAKLDAEIAAQREAARRAELQRQLALLAAAKPVSTSVSAGTVVANPVPGPFMCPVLGAAYTDDYGGPRGHPGIDMFVPTGTQAFAVKAGTVRYVANEGAGGNTAYLNATDGNTYFYAHLSQFVGGARSVVQGEVLALTGMTGNATAPHLHFEIRLGGDNGARTDPYPTLKAAGC